MDKTPAERLKRRVEREILFSLHDYIIGMIPEKVRKIVGWILLIFGVVAMLGFLIGGLFFGLIEHDGFSIITSIVGCSSIVLGLIFLTNSFSMVRGR